MPYELRFAPAAEARLRGLEAGGAGALRKLKKVRKALAHLQQDPRYPGLNSHQYENFPGVDDKTKVWDSYVENNTPSAWRIFWTYGPNETRDGQEVPVIMILAITPHP